VAAAAEEAEEAMTAVLIRKGGKGRKGSVL
jgi:hypothetical protein